MQATTFRLPVMAGVLLSLLAFSQAEAGVSLIISAEPRPQTIVVEPRGYTRCYTVPQGFYNNVWHYRHRVCEYPDPSGFRMWVSGYWQCIAHDRRGRCTRTYWMDSHWAEDADWEYQIGFERHRHYSQGPRDYNTHGQRGMPFNIPLNIPRNTHGQGGYGQGYGGRDGHHHGQ